MCSSVDEDDTSMLHSVQDNSTVDSDSEDVCNESYEVLLTVLMIFSHKCESTNCYCCIFLTLGHFIFR